MSALWPAFKLVRREGPAALWQGTVRPLLQTYWVSVFYRAPLMVERYSVRSCSSKSRSYGRPCGRAAAMPKACSPTFMTGQTAR